jgi:hypothetical protein
MWVTLVLKEPKSWNLRQIMFRLHGHKKGNLVSNTGEIRAGL